MTEETLNDTKETCFRSKMWKMPEDRRTQQMNTLTLRVVRETPVVELATWYPFISVCKAASPVMPWLTVPCFTAEVLAVSRTTPYKHSSPKTAYVTVKRAQSMGNQLCGRVDNKVQYTAHTRLNGSVYTSTTQLPAASRDASPTESSRFTGKLSLEVRTCSWHPVDESLTTVRVHMACMLDVCDISHR
jgi:hypothetical protein